MKAIVRITTLVLLLAVMLPFVPASAQDGGEDELVLAPEISAVYFLSASSGSFADNGDGSYTLTLEGVGEELVWIATQPTILMSTLSNVNLNEQWAASEGLATNAVLEVGDLNVMLTLTSPAFDTGTQTFIAAVEGIAAPEGVKEPELPMTFEGVNLLIGWSLDFQNGLVEGIVAMYEGVRVTPEECAAAQTAWNNFVQWHTQAITNLSQLQSACNGGDAQACSDAQALSREIYAQTIKYQTYPTLLARYCQ